MVRGRLAAGLLALAFTAVLLAPAAQAYQYPRDYNLGQDKGKWVYVSSHDKYMGAPTFNWIELSGISGTKLTTTTPYMSAATAASTIPFTFKFYGTVMTSVLGCTAGVAVFQGFSYQSCPTGDYSGSYYEQPVESYPYEEAILAHQANLYLDPTTTVPGAMYAGTVGSPGSQTFVMEWSNTRYCTADSDPSGSGAPTCTAAAGTLTFEIQLHEDTQFAEVHYKTMDLTGVPAYLQLPCGTTGYCGAYYTGSQEGTMGESTWCFGTCTKGISYRYSCMPDADYPYTNWYTNKQISACPSKDFSMCYDQVNYGPPTCSTFGDDDGGKGFAIRYYLNHPPTGDNIVATVNEDAPTPLVLTGADAQPDGRALFAWLDNVKTGNRDSLITSKPGHGTAVAIAPLDDHSNGAILYTPDPNYNGPDSFTFQVSDGFVKDTASYTATLNVVPIDDPPATTSDDVQVWDNPHSFTFDVAHPYQTNVKGILANDDDVEIRNQESTNGECWAGGNLGTCAPPHQTMSVDTSSLVGPSDASSGGSFTQNADGSFTYTPDPGFTGTDAFTYVACDDNAVSTRQQMEPTPVTGTPLPAANGCSPPTPVTLRIRSYALRAQDDAYTVREWDGNRATDEYFFAPGSGFFDNDPGAANATSVVIDSALFPGGPHGPRHGILRSDDGGAFRDGAFSYIPDPYACNTPGGVQDDVFYHLERGSARGNTARVSINVLCVDDPPVWLANATDYHLTARQSLKSDPYWAFGASPFSLARGNPANDIVPVPGNLLAGPCTPDPELSDECQTQQLRFTVQDDNPAIFTSAGLPTVDVYRATTFSQAPWLPTDVPGVGRIDSYQPILGWLKWTLSGTVGGVAHLNICLVDDGIQRATASAPGSIASACRLVTVTVDGPPLTHPDTYTAYQDHNIQVSAQQGVLANDENSTGITYPTAPLTAKLFAAPTYAGSFVFQADGSFQYAPAPGYSGPDSFLYQASEGSFVQMTPETATIDVLAGAPPGAAFSWDPPKPVAGQGMTFVDASGVSGCASISSWAWDFGDGTSSATESPAHTYVAPGEYKVRLTIVDCKGDYDQVTQTVEVGAQSAANDAQYHEPGGPGAPVAYAGEDFSVLSGAPVRLIGSAEPIQTIASWTWSQLDGPRVKLENPASASTGFVAPTLAAGETAMLTFQLTVYDGVSQSAPSVLHVLVHSIDESPLAHAGGHQAVKPGAHVVLDATGSSDPEHEALTYAWTQTSGPAVVLEDASSATPSFTAPAVAHAELAFQLKLSDGHTAPTTDIATVTIDVAAEVTGFRYQVGGQAEPGKVSFFGGQAATTWDFGDGTQGTGVDPVHVYARAGSYPVSMTTGTGVVTQTVTVTNQPHAAGASATTHGTPALGLVVLLAFVALAVALRRR